MALEANEPVWFSVRCVVQHVDGFEERITLWRARSFDDAKAQAEDESEEYAGLVGAHHVGATQAFCLSDDELGQGSEVFSLHRHSDLDAESYLRRFLVTGVERPPDVDLLGDERFFR